MELVGTGFGGVVDVGACCAAVLARVTIGYYADLLQLVRAEQQVAGAGVVQVIRRIVVIVTIHGVEVGSARLAVGREIAVAAASAHRNARGHQSIVGDVLTGAGYPLNRFAINGRRDVAVVGLQQWSSRADFNGFSLTPYLQLDGNVAYLSGRGDDCALRGRETGATHRQRIRAGLHEREPEGSSRASRSCFVKTSFRAREVDGSVRNNCARGVSNRSTDFAGNRALRQTCGRKNQA